jgi:ribonuclease G
VPGGEVGTPIERLLTEGRQLLVQVVKDPLGSKGPRLTSLLSIASRHLVLLPHDPHVAVSAKIDDAEPRERLRETVQKLLESMAVDLGVIVRTNAETATEAALADDLSFLVRVWQGIEARGRQAPVGTLVHSDLPLAMRVLRDINGTDISRVRVDNADEAHRIEAFAQSFMPRIADRIEIYGGQGPIFDLHGVEDELNRALHKRVELKSGGHLVIESTEAMTTIDVNTGAFTGHRTLDETVFKTNLEAAEAIARQLRLRNLGGMIVVDFIDMVSDEHRAQVMRMFEKALAADPARIHVYPFSPLGLVQMTRKRTRESLGRIFCEPCPACEGSGNVKTVETVCHEIAREVQRVSRQYEARGFLVLASADVVERLGEEHSGGLPELEAALKRPIRLQVEAGLAREWFDVVPL